MASPLTAQDCAKYAERHGVFWALQLRARSSPAEVIKDQGHSGRGSRVWVARLGAWNRVEPRAPHLVASKALKMVHRLRPIPPPSESKAQTGRFHGSSGPEFGMGVVWKGRYLLSL